MASEKVVVDTSALLSLASADFLWYPLANFELVVPRSVMEEIEKLKAKPETEPTVSKVLGARSRFTIVQPKRGAAGRHRGELDCLQVCTERGIELLVLDDFRAIRRLKPAAISRGVKLLLSAFFIAHAAASREMSREEAFAIFDRMAEERDWVGGRVYTAGKELLTRELKKFR